MANIYRGEEKKFAIAIQAAGFDMDTDDFKIEVKSPKGSVSVLKSGEPGSGGIWANEDGSLVVFYETETVTTPSDDPEGEPVVTTVKNWFGIVDTGVQDAVSGIYKLGKGDLKVIATAYIPDEKAYDGVRQSIDTKVLGTLNEIQ